jgi:uncharacterized 2Fe-2S/4Fe-4S cluster protein (DUF4445 family)
MKEYKVIYQFSHSTCGFQNQITVTAETDINALAKAKAQVLADYRVITRDVKKWTFKI